MTTGGAVLLIMSHPTWAAPLDEYLQLVGVEVRRAESGLHALTQLERAVPDAIVCQAQLEDMSGRELLSIVRSDGQFQEVVFLLLGAVEDDEFGIHDAALDGDASPAEVVQALRPVFGAGSAVAEVSGDLSNLGLDGVLLALGLGRRSGRLAVSQLSSEAEVWLSQGAAVNARYGYLRGEAALLALLRGTRVLLNAEYHFSAQSVDHLPRVIDTPTRSLLLHADGQPAVRAHT